MVQISHVKESEKKLIDYDTYKRIDILDITGETVTISIRDCHRDPKEIQKGINEILQKIQILEDTLQPTDSQGYECEGNALYDGKEYYVYLSFWCPGGYSLQAAVNVYGQINGVSFSFEI